ncbi:YcxB-like protein [Roseimicrobium gellanilyticum]|uniref:YcxB-like protein n=1 Tax=Roseimicrobium gellanilyticum TaxID=748857 RepID=A0A366HUW1_9BACT|nr:YcxB family protein [Roseimicrobium gellanilyticum]RBP48066.1 YcxB-like protein [Roseimicrobium gellanilyticum]
MSVRFTITYWDYLAFSAYHYLHSPLILGIYGICFALVTYVNVGVVSEVNTTAGKLITFVILETVVFGFLVLVLGITTVLGIISRRNKTVLTEHTITVTDDFLAEETVYNKTEQKWAGVQKIARTNRHLIIYIAQHLAHIIPLRAFADKASSDAFDEFCRKKVESARR